MVLEFRSRRFQVSAEDKSRALKYYGSLAGRYDTYVNRHFFRFLRDRERGIVLELARLGKRGGTLLDLGCGDGFYASRAKSLGMRVTAVDAAPEMVERVRSIVDEAYVDDVENLRLDGRFDVVICAGVLDFVLSPQRAVENLCARVAPGGALVLLVPAEGFCGSVYRLEKRMSGIRTNLFTVSWIEEMAAHNGMVLEEVVFPIPSSIACRMTRPLSG